VSLDIWAIAISTTQGFAENEESADNDSQTDLPLPVLRGSPGKRGQRAQRVLGSSA